MTRLLMTAIRPLLVTTNPDFFYGMTNTFAYKEWTFSFFLQGTQGNDILNVNLLPFDLVGSTNMPKSVWDTRWTPENRNIARWPRPDNTYTRSMKASDALRERWFLP